MPVAQGINKTVAYKKQSALGTPASGASGQYVRRETASFNLMKDTFQADEILTHQQNTGATYGVAKTEGSLSGVLSANAYATIIASLMRNDLTATTAITGLSLTIAGSDPWTVTRSTGNFLTGGIKIGDVVRITAGTYTGTARDINMLVTGVTATVLTVVVPNGSTLTTQGPIATSTVTVIGKKSIVPTTGHTNDYYTFEEWYNDLTRSRLYGDVQPASVDLSVPATGNSKIDIAFVGLTRTKGGTQILTSPTAASTGTILSSSNAYVIIAGTRTLVGTSASLKIDGKVAHGEANIGSRTISDLYRGDVSVSGSVSLVHDAETTSDLFTNETAAAITIVLFADNTASSEFVSFVIPRAKFMGDGIDDGKKQLVGTYPFTAEILTTGGAALANDQTILSMQDSAS